MTTKISAKFGEIDFEYTVDSSAPEPQTCYKERRKPQITVRGCASSQLSYNDGTFTCTPTLSTDDPKCPAMTIGGTDVDTDNMYSNGRCASNLPLRSSQHLTVITIGRTHRVFFFLSVYDQKSMFLGQAAVACNNTDRTHKFNVQCKKKDWVFPVTKFSKENPLFHCKHEPRLPRRKDNHVPCAFTSIQNVNVDNNDECKATVHVQATCDPNSNYPRSSP